MASLGLNELTYCGMVRQYGILDFFNIDLVNVLVPSGTEPLAEPMFTYHHLDAQKYNLIKFN